MVALRYFSSTLALLALSLCSLAALSAAQSKGKSTSKVPPKVSTRTTAKAPAKATSKTSGKQAKAKAKPQSAANEAGYRRSGQQAPSQQRYTEIEQALQLRGYLDEVDGKWDKDSVDALKRFQRDQSLKDDGKLGALSLIALGLGPKRMTTTVAQAISGSGSAPPQVE